ncbi:MAG: hypothetical protein MI919_36590 [Holophagales bacterium]|nr:hypothetical protein [Holophagales bacterium]
MTESLSNGKFQPLAADEAAMVLGGAAAGKTFTQGDTNNSDGTTEQDWYHTDNTNVQ